MDELLTAADVERLAELAGLSVKDICARAGIAHTTFYRWRAGKTNIRTDIYQKLRDVVREASAAAD